MKYTFDSSTNLYEALYLQTYGTTTRTTDKYELEIGTDGKGYLDYFWDAWLYGKSWYNIIMLDYDDSIVAYGCDSYFWLFHYQYFWVLNSKPILPFERRMYYMNYIRTKFPSYANSIPTFF